MKLAGALCVVTGASSGIGRATALLLAQKGARVVLVARSALALQQLEAEIGAAGGTAWARPTDLTQPAQVAHLRDWVLEQQGIPQVLVHSAGAGRWQFLDDTSLDELHQLLATPFWAAAYLTRELLPTMRQANRGIILSVCSPVSRLTWPGATGYAASRWALNGLTEALRADLWRTGLQVCAFFPGKVDSEYFQRNSDTEHRIPLVGRLIPTSTPQQVAVRLVRALEREEAQVFFPWMLGVFDGFARWFPGLARYLAWRTGHAR